MILLYKTVNINTCKTTWIPGPRTWIPGGQYLHHIPGPKDLESRSSLLWGPGFQVLNKSVNLSKLPTEGFLGCL